MKETMRGSTKKNAKSAHGTGKWATSNVNIDSGCPNDPLIKWKDSLKPLLGLEQPAVKGLDVSLKQSVARRQA